MDYETPSCDRYVITLAVLSATVCTLVAVFYPVTATPMTDFKLRLVPWIFVQSLLVMLPSIALACWLGQRSRIRRWISAVCYTWVFAVPTLMLLDAIAFHWTGERFLSRAMWRLATELATGLVPHVSVGMSFVAAVTGIGCLLMLIGMHWAARRLSAVWLRSQRAPRPVWGLMGGVMLAGMMAVPAGLNLRETRLQMWLHSSQHPFSVLRLFPSRGVGESIPETELAIDTRLEVDPIVGSLQQAISVRENRLRLLTAVSSKEAVPPRDIVIVVIESFRSELVDQAVMPSLAQLAARGIHCQTHFSGGNATNHGMFSLLNGLEAVWFERPIRFSPVMNRLFRSAGYEVGFFAGHDQWRDFYMDGFLNHDHFDVLEVAPANGLASDRHATMQASSFLGRDDGDARRPRLAVLYLYATHAIYRSYTRDQIFQPAADDRFSYPYSEEDRNAVWNRYKNAARTTDRFLKSILSDDRIVLVTGDHGEAFLEDGTIGHGTRISAVQNMTPAVLYVPDLAPRAIRRPTCHADLLPALLSAANLELSDPTALDGIDLLHSDGNDGRIFVTRNYLQPDVALIGPWTVREEGPFAYRASISLNKSTVESLNPIDKQGYETKVGSEAIDEAVQQWRALRFE
ncbi:MAG: sulfatase-like hydrolase/transferase [Rubripirellula sp.]